MRCEAQDQAAVRVRAQFDRLEQRLRGKQVVPLFVTCLYAVNCDQHDAPANHVDLVTTHLDKLSPGGLQQVIASTEALLAALKKRMT